MNSNTVEISMKREYILGGDISASMNQVDPRCDGMTRFNYMLDRFKQFVTIACDFDTHEGGVTVMLFGAEVQVFEHTTLEVIERKLKNINFEGLTNTDELINAALEEHREERREAAKEGKLHPGTCLMIFTDGDPTNPAGVKRAIDQIKSSVDRDDEFTIVFLTVGTVSVGLSSWLDSLDKQIVSVKELDKVTFISAVTE